MRRALLLCVCIGACSAGCTCEEPRTGVPLYRAPHVTEAPVIDGAWDDAHLYVAFEVEDDFLKSDLEGHDPHLWEQDTVEIMVDPGGDGRSYFELQLSPTGQIFDTRYDSRRVPQPFGHTSWDSGMRGASVARGTPNDDERDEGYVAEMAIPWSAFAHGSPPASRPEAGEEWRIALYVLDARPNGGQGGVGWSPPLIGDFHVPERFGRVVFEGR